MLNIVDIIPNNVPDLVTEIYQYDNLSSEYSSMQPYSVLIAINFIVVVRIFNRNISIGIGDHFTEEYRLVFI